ncbi:MAG: heme-degrading domain-containing protein [Gemmobacter sp.]
MDIAELEAEAARLILPRFDEGVALDLGLRLLDLARARNLPVVIDIRDTARTYFHAALPGSKPLNDHWARRKSATVLVIHEASLLVGRKNAANGETVAKHGLDPMTHADHGGAVPLRVAGGTVVAVATVSGLPQVEDHRLVVEAILAMLDPQPQEMR